MPPMNDYSGSICFSDTQAAKLNQLSFKLDKRVFLFAYYEPKQFVAEESNYSLFRTAIANMYGLIKDCCPFFDDLINNSNGILSIDWKKTQSDYATLSSVVSAFRSIFCHNCSPNLRLNERQYWTAEDWASDCLSKDVTLWEIKENEWGKLLARLVSMSQKLFDDLEKNLNLLFGPKAMRSQDVVNSWISAITSAYCRNPDYLLHSMAGLYDWYIDNGGDTSRIRAKTYRKKVTQWLKYYCAAPDDNRWFTRWLDPFDKNNPSQNQLYCIIHDWPRQWAKWNNASPKECNEPPLPGGILFHLLASDVYDYAAEPYRGYTSN